MNKPTAKWSALIDVEVIRYDVGGGMSEFEVHLANSPGIYAEGIETVSLEELERRYKQELPPTNARRITAALAAVEGLDTEALEIIAKEPKNERLRSLAFEAEAAMEP